MRWLLLLIAAIYIWPSDSFGLYGPDEPRYASIGREMARTGDWVTPVLDGKPWFEKPPLLYWLIATGFKLGLGPETAPRLPVAVLSVLFLWFFYWRLQQWMPPGQSEAAAVILATMPGWVAYGNVAVTDVPLAAMFAAGMLLAHEWIEEGSAWKAAAAGTFFGLAILAKGLVPVVLAAPLLWSARRRWMEWPLAIGAGLAVALPWYVVMTRRFGWAFIDEFFLEQHFERFTSSSLQHAQPWWFYVPVLIGLTLPWCWKLFGDIWLSPRVRYFAVWAAFGFLFFSASLNKLWGYMLPLLPALAVMIATRIHWTRRLQAAVACFCVMVPVAKILLGARYDSEFTARAIAKGVPADACASEVPRGLRYGLHYYLGRKLGECWEMPGATPIGGQSAAPARGAMVAVRLAYGSEPVSGRLLFFAQRSEQVWMAAREVQDWQPGTTRTLNPSITSYPGPFSDAGAGAWRISALLDPNHSYAYAGVGEGDLLSETVELAFNPANTTTLELTLARVSEPKSHARIPGARSMYLRSKLLSRFHRRDVVMRALLLPGPVDAPLLLVLHRFGEDYRDVSKRDANAQVVLLDCAYENGFHGFVDSDVNGPWGRALVDELLPAIENGVPIALYGEDVGGYAVRWLERKYPGKFVSVTAVDPSPIDFRNFYGADLTKPLVRMVEPSAVREAVMGKTGGRWNSFEAMYGPRTSEGAAAQLFDRATGAVDDAVRRMWLRYSIH